MHLQKKVFILLMPLFVFGCSDESSDEDVVFKLSISEITANSATVMVMHNATNRDAYYGFAVEGVVSDVQSEINYFLSHTDSNKLIEAVHYQRKSVFQVRGLKPEKTFTYIIFGMNEDGLIYGKPASVEFKTEKSNMVATENPNWVIKYKGHVVYNDNDYSLISVSLNGEVEERFFLATYSLEFASSFDRVENLITYAANEFIEEKTKVSDYWLETSQVRTEGTYFYRYLQEGDYVSYAIGLNADGLPTGHYVTTGTYHVDKYPVCAEYANLLNEWVIMDENGKRYFVKFSERVVNKSLIMEGWGNYDEYPIVVTFNRSDASLKISSQIVADHTSLSFNDGSVYQGRLSLRGAYFDENSKLKWTTQNLTLASAKVAEDGTYSLTSGYYVTLGNGTRTYETGLSFYLENDDGNNIGVARMMFPLVMKKMEDL